MIGRWRKGCSPAEQRPIQGISMSDAPKTLRTSQAVRQAPVPYSGLPGTLKPGKTLRIGVISNPLSGGNRKGMHAIRAALAGSPQAYHFEASTPLEVGEALAEFAHRKVGIVAVNGGDGTIHAVLTELFRRPAPGPGYGAFAVQAP